jgi:hypothetical protein
MPGLAEVPRKPTRVGRGPHTNVDVDNGVIHCCEIWEGMLRMGSKDYITKRDKNHVKAMKCTKRWHGIGRTLIIDVGFALVKCAKGLVKKGWYTIGHLKASTVFQNKSDHNTTSAFTNVRNGRDGIRVWANGRKNPSLRIRYFGPIYARRHLIE